MKKATEHWQQHNLTTCWAKKIGSNNNPYGDIFREILVNPIVVAFAKEALTAKKKNSTEDPHFRLPLYNGVAEQHHSILGNYETEKIRDWHSDTEKSTDLTGIRVLDLGCGEAYLGRWLTRMGATYIGVDLPKKPASPLEYAETRFSQEVKSNAIQPRQFHLIPADLDGSHFDPAPLDLALDNEGPDIIVMNVLLDHLTNPAPLLRWIGDLYKEYKKRPTILCWTLNPDYYQGNEEDNFIDGPLTGSIIRYHIAPIRSIGESVPVFLRCPLTYESYFTDANLNVIQTTPLDFPRHPKYLGGEDKSFHDGESPFIAWQLCQRALSICPTEANDLEALFSNSACVLNQLVNKQRNLLRKQITSLKVEDYSANAPLVYPHNLGGDLIIIFKGTAFLNIRGENKRKFSVPELLGDFETWSDELPKRYLYPVYAGEDGATVMRIPNRVVQRLLQNAKTLSELIFSQLRDRFYSQIWLYEMRYLSKSYFLKGLDQTDGDLKVNIGRVNRIARAILYASGLESEKFSRTSRHSSVFLPVNDLVSFTREGVSSGDSPELMKKIINILVGIRVIDSFPPSNLYDLDNDTKTTVIDTDVRSSRLARIIWEQIMLDAAQSIYSSHWKKLNSIEVRCLSGESIPEFSLMYSIVNLKNGQIKKEAKHALSASGGPLHTAEAVGIPRDLVESWFRYIAKAQYFLFKQERPCLTFINNPFLLRSIALDDDPWIEQLLLAQCQANEPVTHRLKKRIQKEELWPKSEFPRRKRYLLAIREFVKSDLAKGSRLAFSGLLTPENKVDMTMQKETFKV
ncbi:MAG: methyltransferase domain-containing protein [Candidatus Thiodiazotropha sp.]